MVLPPSTLFFLMKALVVWGLLCLYTNFKIFCSSSVENAIGNLIRIEWNLLEKCKSKL